MPSAGMSDRRQPRQAAGTGSALDVLGRGFRGPSPDASAADIQAIDEGTIVWMSCSVRATYGGYPRRFRQRTLHLTAEGMMLRPLWYSVPRTTFRITDTILDSGPRPHDIKTDWNLKSTGRYGERGQFSFAGFVVIACRTERGTIELAVPRPDVPLLLHYLHRANPGPVA